MFEIQMVKLKNILMLLKNYLLWFIIVLLWSIGLMLMFDFFLKTGLSLISLIECMAIYFIVNEIELYKKIMKLRWE